MKKEKLKSKFVSDFFCVNAIELTEKELRTQVNGGRALTPAEQQEMALRARNGDYSLPDFVKEASDVPTPALSYEEQKKMAEKAEHGDYSLPDSVKEEMSEDKESEETNFSKSDVSVTTSENSCESTPSYNPVTSSSNSDSNHSDYTPLELKKESNQTFEEEVDYTKNGDDVMGVTIRTKNEDGTYDYSFGKVGSKFYKGVTNKVKSAQERGNPVLFNGYYYYPQQFPDGNWNLTKVDSKMDDLSTYGPFAVKSDAYVEVSTYNKDGTEIVGTAIDEGYLVHTGKNLTTWGCLKMADNSDSIDFARMTFSVLGGGGKATISVSDANLIF